MHIESKNLWGAMALGLVGAMTAQGVEISGSVQASYNRNLSASPDSMANIGRSYDAQANTYTLNNAHLAFTGEDKATGLGFAVELDAGTDGMADAGLSTGFPFLVDVQEAYLTKAFGASGAGIKAGKFVTTMGIEVVEGGANPTISRGYLFGYAECISHTGVAFTYAAGMLDILAGAVNGWDIILDNNTMPSYIAKLGLNFGDPLAVSLSAIIGPEAAGNNEDLRLSFDLTGITKAIPMTDLWFQGNYGMEPAASAGTTDDVSWFGFTVQPVVKFNNLFGLGLRYEFFSDGESYRSALFNDDLTLQNVTVAPTFWLTPNLMARAEFRMDFASEDVFLDADAAPTATQMTAAADMVVSF